MRGLSWSADQTPSWAVDAAPDQCDDPLSKFAHSRKNRYTKLCLRQGTCCCNSIAWSLRMLCIKYVALLLDTVVNNIMPG